MKTRLMVFVAVVAYFYLAAAFVIDDANPHNWGQEFRFCFVWLASVVGLLAATYPGLTKE